YARGRERFAVPLEKILRGRRGVAHRAWRFVSRAQTPWRQAHHGASGVWSRRAHHGRRLRGRELDRRSDRCGGHTRLDPARRRSLRQAMVAGAKRRRGPQKLRARATERVGQKGRVMNSHGCASGPLGAALERTRATGAVVDMEGAMTRPLSDKQPKKLADDARLLKAWKKFHYDEREAVLAGPYASTLSQLFRMFANIECVKPAQFISFIGAINWAAIDYQTRLTVLHEVNTAITKFREKRGLDPIDDPRESTPRNAFQIIRKIITEFPAQRGGQSERSDKQ